MGECGCLRGVLFPGCWFWWLRARLEGAVEAAGQVEILKWACDVVGQCHPGLTDFEQNGVPDGLDLQPPRPRPFAVYKAPISWPRPFSTITHASFQMSVLGTYRAFALHLDY